MQQNGKSQGGPRLVGVPEATPEPELSGFCLSDLMSGHGCLGVDIRGVAFWLRLGEIRNGP